MDAEIEQACACACVLFSRSSTRLVFVLLTCSGAGAMGASEADPGTPGKDTGCRIDSMVCGVSAAGEFSPTVESEVYTV